MASTSNSLTSAGKPRGSDALVPRICLARAWCWGRPPHHHQGNRLGLTLPGGLLVWDGGAAGLESCFQTQPGPLPYPWLCRGVCAASSGGDGQLWGPLHVLAVATGGLATPTCSFAHANPMCVGCDVLGRILGAGVVAFVPLTNACLVVVVVGCFCSLGTLTAEPAAHPGTAPEQGTWPQEKAATGDREEGGEAGNLLGEALRPARTPPCPAGLIGTPSPRAGGMRCAGTVAAGVVFGNLG